MPVTGSEKILQDNDVIVSKTDTKGLIIYINKTFMDISGFTEEELIGAPQNLVRHPDMPPAAFKDLWDTLQAGKSWKGLVKNRCKNGDHYWVEANANPIFENGTVTGYMSLRTKPSREQVEFAENLYRKIREGRAQGWTVKEGRALRTGLGGFINRVRNPNLSTRLSWLVGSMLALTIGLTGVGLFGMSKANDGLESSYKDSTVPLGQVTGIGRLILNNRLLIATAIITPADSQKNMDAMDKNIADIGKIWEEFTKRKLSADEQKLVDAFTEDRKKFVGEGLKPASAMLRAGKTDEAKKHTINVIRPLGAEVTKDVNALVKYQTEAAENGYKVAVSRYEMIRIIALIALALGAALGIMLSISIVRGITRPLKEVEDVAMAVSSGDLTRSITVRSEDEIGRVLQAVKNVNGNLRGIVSDVRGGVGNIATSAQEVAAGSNDLAQRTQEAASALEETASSMEEMTSTTKQSADNARQANQLATGARDQATSGGEVVNKAVAAMSEINASSRKIADIIGVIDEIAFQTNLLALNAAVEAARAGEQGRGFAVVASEVRNLAQRSAGAAKEIKGLISDSVEKVKTGSQYVDESGKTLGEIVGSVKKVTDIVAEIAAASQEQSSGIDQVNKAVMQMDEMTQQNAALVEESSAASRSMEEQAKALDVMMNFFRLGSGDGAARATEVRRPRPVDTSGGADAGRKKAKLVTPAAPRAKAAPLPKTGTGDNDGSWQEF
jgi:methyl-accepting chemotaxis protein/aerotaxis receptor